jgi:general stress protein 26
MRDTDATSGPAVPDPISGELPDQQESRSLEALVRAGDVAFVTTVDRSGAMSSRPLTVAEVHGGILMFLVDAGAPWFVDLDPDAVHVAPAVHVTIANGRNDWIAMRGRPAVSADRATIERLWSPAASAYFDDRDDPGIRALQISVIDGDYWSAPGGGVLGRLASVVGAALGRDGHAAGNTHGDVRRD